MKVFLIRSLSIKQGNALDKREGCNFNYLSLNRLVFSLIDYTLTKNTNMDFERNNYYYWLKHFEFSTAIFEILPTEPPYVKYLEVGDILSSLQHFVYSETNIHRKMGSLLKRLDRILAIEHVIQSATKVSTRSIHNLSTQALIV